ncbi:MAG: polysaccharide deacetylase [Syntrophaceae bacterium CG2_30_49_12]|nr:MAG: polysaccharide deacetylase [Syntrophaceae bacterium CG2_30_49_12]PIP05118.1 MAG: polysaccharide deacetylase [Syntrophobacterales bacterium CG23_combo_of_CG06-09_8_20_14_all_48_27]PJC75032.1 MAG: polysaccharide deacetylase [Syntrophobacterales bacterium CG_4_8_14_3_um_filter_49_14]
MSVKSSFFMPLVLLAVMAGCGPTGQCQETGGDYEKFKETIILRFKDRVPRQWGETVPGVKTKLNSTKKVIALTLDACGSKNDGYDSRLMDYLIRENIPATLFINARWIDKYPREFKVLATNSLFEIENHGFAHKPCSVNGRSIYGINGTSSVGEVVDEIEKGARKIASLTGRKPLYYRSGTAYYDEVAVEVAAEMGYQIAGFSILGDAGASYSQEQVRNALLRAEPGDVIICHMNHPESETAEGIIEAVGELKKRGFIFVRLSDSGMK